MDANLDPAAATVSAFAVEQRDGGVILSWGDDPLDFIWQSEAQTRDLIAKLTAALSVK